MDNGTNLLIIADELESTARKIKAYVDNQRVNFTGATTLAGGASGFVPAPSVNDFGKFLSAGGSWAQLTLDTVSSSVEGALWLEVTE